MKDRRLLFVGLALCMLPLGAVAQSPFDGTWRIVLPESEPSVVHHDYLLKNGMYSCTTCDPKIELPADGRDHKITGEPCYDTVSLKVVNENTTEEIDKRGGKVVSTSKMTVSPDGKTLTQEWTESCSATGDIVAGKNIQTRLNSGPAGSHPISGSWRIIKRVNVTENALVITLKLTADTFSFSDPTNQKFTAKLDGTDTPFQGDLAGTVVSVRRIGENVVEENNKHADKIYEVDRFTISADGKTLTVTIENKLNGTTQQLVAHKQ